jgi:hypothetical protein
MQEKEQSRMEPPHSPLPSTTPGASSFGRRAGSVAVVSSYGVGSYLSMTVGVSKANPNIPTGSFNVVWERGRPARSRRVMRATGESCGRDAQGAVPSGRTTLPLAACVAWTSEAPSGVQGSEARNQKFFCGALRQRERKNPMNIKRHAQTPDFRQHSHC